jgi:hypothetical protein
MMTVSYTEDWIPGSPGQVLVERAFGTAKALGRRHDADLLICMYPILSQLDDYPLRSVHAELARIAAKHQIDYVDLLPALEGMKATALHAHQHDKHPNGTANRYVAEFLYPLLEQRARAAF